KTNDYTELLLNLSVVDQDGVVYHLIHDIDEDDFNIEKNGQVEIIGWLYQYYISERHNQIININKGVVRTEDVPAATQLFTTDWVVRYMVDNSLGRYWIERNPQSNLREKLEFFVAPKNGKFPLVNEKVEPQDLTFFDPCMGSGHILVYAFDVLMEIYTECGYSARNAASEIVSHNLFGLDIDARAYQLAYFALMMKARQYDRRFFTRGIAPQVYCPRVDKDLLELGSLVQVDSLGDKPQEPEELTLFNLNYEATLNNWNFRRLLAQKYAVVCTNPPYLNKYNEKLKKFVTENYKDYSGDLFSVFMYRNFGFCKKDGYSAFMTPFVWMFIKTYEKLRDFIIRGKSIISLIQMEYSAFEEATVPLCSFVLQNCQSENNSLCFRLSDFKGGMEVQKQKVLEALENPDCGYFYEAQQSNFSSIPGSSVAYWASPNILNAFAKGKLLEQYADCCTGMQTGNNDKYIRYWFEVSAKDFSPKAISSGDKWVKYNCGGDSRKWYGNHWRVIMWENNGFFVRNEHGSVIRNESHFFQEGISWKRIGSSDFFLRYLPQGFIIDQAGDSMYFAKDQLLYYILGFVNTSVALSMFKFIAPTLNLTAGNMNKLPIIIDLSKESTINNIVVENIEIARIDWDAFETSWNFKRNPMTVDSHTVVFGEEYKDKLYTHLDDHYRAWKKECEDRFISLQINEEELNRIFIDIYGLQDELTPEVADKDITVHRIYDTKDDIPESMKGSNYVRTKQDEIVSLLSYAVGCMFGRYSLDMEGLAYAGGDWDESKYKTFLPDVDGILPITDEEYLGDDIVTRLCSWLKVVYGEDTLEENLDFIAKALGGRGNSSREIIRNYFLKDFFKDHCKIYQKRPIYWLFDSGKQNGFKALIYLHRYTPNTIGNLRVDYLHKMQRVYESEIGRMQDMIDHSTNAREVAVATKRKEKLQKQLKECRDYDEMIAHLALSRIDLDLDDGVKVNYRKIQTAADGKFYEVLADSKSIMAKEK
ncbi:BREX-1 system adenine-specific DNA-methyltransferase PglX, partial [Catenibacillus scindens]|uniref:BREX-1 system adenine-specific DNA-methyltransferase PglX n=1 Tax=Catenibacillus scindens TaxID=673271 RepID=UPI003209D1D8